MCVFGKNRNLIKIECHSTNVRDSILKQSRINKPKGIYVVDYLSFDKLQVFRRLNDLRKQLPHHIKTVYTRRGDIFGKIGSDDLVQKFNSLEDVEALDLPPMDIVRPSVPDPSSAGDGSDGVAE